MSLSPPALALRLGGHASVLGWLLCCELLGPPWLALAELHEAAWIGVELEAPVEALPAEIKFVVHAAALTGPQAWSAIVVGDPGQRDRAETVLGWIED